MHVYEVSLTATSNVEGDPFMCMKSASQRLQMLKVIHVYEVSLTATSNVENDPFNSCV